MVDSGVDVAIRYGTMDDSSYVSRSLAPSHRVLCVSPNYINACGKPETPQDLLNHRCLVVGMQPFADWRLGEEVVRIIPSFCPNDGDVMHQMALEEHGIALGRSGMWRVTCTPANSATYCRNSRLPPPHCMSSVRIGTTWHPHLANTGSMDIGLKPVTSAAHNHCWRSAFHRANVAARASAVDGCLPIRATTPKRYAATATNIECNPSSRCAR